LKTIKIFLLSSAMVALNACTLFDDTSVGTARQEYLGWYCEADIDVSDEWHCSERLMSDALPIDKVPQRLEKVPQRLGKVPMPTAKGRAVEKNLFEQAPEKQAPKKRVEQQVEQDPSSSFDISADGYTVQLGAYLSRTMAEQSAAKIITEGGQLEVHNIIVGGQYRFVIVCGQHVTRQQAEIVGEQLTALNPQLDYWVRSIKSLRNSL
jgi:septal ring-binding cell division protein DamX